MESFQWFIPNYLAGSALPGRWSPLEEDLEFLQKKGFRWIVSLTQQPLVIPTGWPLRVFHFPITDMGIPTPEATAQLCAFLLEKMSQDEAALLHCRAGLGRTGTIGACVLSSLGLPAEDSVQRLRSMSRYYLQTDPQIAFVGHYVEYLEDLFRADAAPAVFRKPGSQNLFNFTFP